MKALWIPTLTLIAGATASMAQSRPPSAPLRPVTDDYFGTKVTDDYRYMENLKDPEVLAWMKAQAEFTRARLDALSARKPLLDRIVQLEESQPADVHGLQTVGNRYYTLSVPSGAQVEKLYVRDGVKGKDRLLIDPEKLSGATGGHSTIHSFRPSPDGRYVAYDLAAGGSEESVLHILDVRAGRDLAETADRAGSDPPYWRQDSRSFFYSRRQKLLAGMPPTEKYKNARDYLHRLGHPFDEDTPVMGRGVTEAFAIAPEEYPEIITAIGSRYALAILSPGTESRLRVYAALTDSIVNGKAAWRAVAESYEDHLVGSDHEDELGLVLHGDTLYWLSRKSAPRGEVLKLDLANAKANPDVVVKEGALSIAALYGGRDALYWRVMDAGTGQAFRHSYQTGSESESLRGPSGSSVDSIVTNMAGAGAVLDVVSWARSAAYIGVDPSSGAVADTGLRGTGPFDRPQDLVVEDLRVKSWDGAEVPLSIIRKKDVVLDGSHPTVLIGYGSYGVTLSPMYNPYFQAPYERGVILAVAHVRGGGEYGETWRLGGYKANKPNTWKDFIACAQYLIAHNYSSPEKLVGLGGSAGGILVGRAIEERPDLFSVAIIDVPAADMLRFETTANGAANVPEFGSVATEEGFRALREMSAYAHVHDGTRYPAVLIETGMNDHRVDPWQPAKLAARMQAVTASGKPVLLRVDYDAGHTGLDATKRQHAETFADEISFILWQTGNPEFQPK